MHTETSLQNVFTYIFQHLSCEHKTVNRDMLERRERSLKTCEERRDRRRRERGEEKKENRC